jgi:hypothetical protein
VAALKCDLASLGELAIRSMSSRYRINLIPNRRSVETIGLVSFMKVRGALREGPETARFGTSTGI